MSDTEYGAALKLGKKQYQDALMSYAVLGKGHIRRKELHRYLHLAQWHRQAFCF